MNNKPCRNYVALHTRERRGTIAKVYKLSSIQKEMKMKIYLFIHLDVRAKFNQKIKRNNSSLRNIVYRFNLLARFPSLCVPATIRFDDFR